MTIMDSTQSNYFWYELHGPKSGIKHHVKNLGWIINRAKNVQEIHISHSIGNGAHFQARFDNISYYAKFESFEGALSFSKKFKFAKLFTYGDK